MFKWKSTSELSNLDKRWELAEIKINKYLHRVFKKNMIINPEDHYFEKKDSFYFKIEMLESYNFYLKNKEVIVEQKPLFSNDNGYLIINYQNQTVMLKTSSYKVNVDISKLSFLSRNRHIESDGYDTFKHSIHLTNIFSTDTVVFKFLSIEPVKIAILLHIIIRALSVKSLYLHKINNFIKIRG